MRILVSTLALATTLSFAATAGAAELKPGTVLNASNLAGHLSDSFENHPISDLLTERMQKLIKDEGLTITLKASQPVELGRDYLKATQDNAGKAKYNHDTRRSKAGSAAFRSRRSRPMIRTPRPS